MKGAEIMAVFRVKKNKGYTVMSNHHLRNKELTLKAKGLLSQMLSLLESRDYTFARLSIRIRINAQLSSIFRMRSCSFLATRILRLLANIIISLLTRRQRGTIASIIPKKLNPNKINER